MGAPCSQEAKESSAKGSKAPPHTARVVGHPSAAQTVLVSTWNSKPSDKCWQQRVRS